MHSFNGHIPRGGWGWQGWGPVCHILSTGHWERMLGNLGERCLAAVRSEVLLGSKLGSLLGRFYWESGLSGLFWLWDRQNGVDPKWLSSMS